VDAHFLERWLKMKKGDVDLAEEAVRGHAAWRAEYMPAGRVLEVGLVPVFSGLDSTPSSCNPQHDSTSMAPIVHTARYPPLSLFPFWTIYVRSHYIVFICIFSACCTASRHWGYVVANRLHDVCVVRL
jgi:hypothetical protein